MSTEGEYDRSTCPYCATEFDPLPKAKKRCPSCGGTVWVRSGPDGRRHILREADLEAHEARWAAHREAQERQWAAQSAKEAARLMASTLRDYARLGVMAEFLAVDDACSVCRAFRGRIYDPREAPPIPVPGCLNPLCRCDYLPQL